MSILPTISNIPLLIVSDKVMTTVFHVLGFYLFGYVFGHLVSPIKQGKKNKSGEERGWEDKARRQRKKE